MIEAGVIEVLLAAVLGLVIGSFLNVCIHRLPEDESVLEPRRSYCPHCRQTIAWYDNVPLLSFFLLRGRCRHCQAAISWRYPIVEALTALLFAWTIQTHGWNLVGLKYCVFAAILVDLVFTDYETYILPDEFTLGGAAAGVVLAAVTPPSAPLLAYFFPKTWPLWVAPLVDSAFAACTVAGLLWLTGASYRAFRNWRLSRKLYRRMRERPSPLYKKLGKELYPRIRKTLPRWTSEVLGLGDVKMLLMVGAFLGLPAALLTIFLGAALGSVIGGLYIRLARKGWEHELPFGSFLGVAAIFVGLFGDSFFKWYWKLG